MQIITNQEKTRGILIEQDSGFVLTSKAKSATSFVSENRLRNTDEFSLDNPFVYAVMQKAGIKNRNGRIYSKKLLDREVEKYMEFVNMGAAVGESDHADTSNISVKGISMQIVDLWWEGVTLMGKIHVPFTDGFKKSGIISCEADKIAHYILKKIQIGISSRGVGSLKKEKDYHLVDDDFELVCWDWVTMPSTIGSWVYGSIEDTKPHVSMESDVEIKETKANKMPAHLQKLFGTQKENYTPSNKKVGLSEAVDVLSRIVNKK